MARLKWNVAENVSFNRSNHTALIFKVDNSEYWFRFCAGMTTQTFKSLTRNFAQYVGAKTVEVKQEWLKTESGYKLNNDVVPIGILEVSGEYKYRIEHDVPEGAKREFTYFDEKELFKG